MIQGIYPTKWSYQKVIQGYEVVKDCLGTDRGHSVPSVATIHKKKVDYPIDLRYPLDQPELEPTAWVGVQTVLWQFFWPREVGTRVIEWSRREDTRVHHRYSQTQKGNRWRK